MKLQRTADRNNMKGFYNGLKEVWGPKKTEPVLSSFHSRQNHRQDPPQQTLYPHNTRGSSGDTMWLKRKLEHRGYDILSPTATRKVHGAGSTTVHGIY